METSVENKMHYKVLRRLTEALDSNGKRVPFSMVYCDKQGNVRRVNNAVCTSVEPAKMRRVCVWEENGQSVSRTLRDCLIMAVNGIRLMVS